MRSTEEQRYLKGLGFQLMQGSAQGAKEESATGAQVKLTGPFVDENWMLAWHLFRGRISLEPSAEKPKRSTSSEGGKQAIEDLADGIIASALEAQASDIHLEPGQSALRLRYRLDGHLTSQPDIPLDKRDHLVAHLKIRAGMDIAEKRRPQDGRIRFELNQRSVDLRVSTLSTQYGEKMVLRILDKSDMNLDLAELGLQNHQLPKVAKAISAPYGMVLVTGPTGSGKTTTLYSCLANLKSDALNITTIEDPIEYQLDGVNQTQVKPDIGITFSSSLRTFLRQDPNVIMVGEIRDEETAELSVRAALTGHLVLSTLHTNDACSTIPRLCEMGVPGHLLSASLNLVIAQRLVRKLCHRCKASMGQAIPEDWARFGVKAGGPVVSPVGCDTCCGTGYRGRLALFEVLVINEKMKALIASESGADTIRRAAAKAGMTTLAEQAARYVQLGETSLEEAIKEAIQ